MKIYSTTKYCGRIYPTGEFSFGMNASMHKSEKRKSDQYEKLASMQYYDILNEDGSVWMRVPLDAAKEVFTAAATNQENRLYMGLSIAQNSRKVPQKYGMKGISSYGQKMVKSGAYLMEKEYGKKALSFITYTLPPMPEEFRIYLHENWGKFVNRITEEISREIKRNGGKINDYIGVSEIQEERLRKTGNVYLHLHIIIFGRKAANEYYINPESNDRIFSMVLHRFLRNWESLSGKEIGGIALSTKSACQIKSIRKSAYGYIGKYLSKGVRSMDKVSDTERARCLPRTWWFVSNSLRKKIKASILHPPSSFFAKLAREDSSIAKYIGYIRAIEKEYEEQTYILGYTGRLIGKWRDLPELFEPEPSEKTPNNESEAALAQNDRIRICDGDRVIYLSCPRISRRRPNSSDHFRARVNGD